MAIQPRQIGAILNERYRILRVLGQGGAGTVYLAEHIQLDSVVAVKEISGRDPQDEDYQTALARCRHEGRILVRLNHPNLPKVTDAFVQNDSFYLVMEYIQGVTTEALLYKAGKTLPVHEVIGWGLQLTAVLGYLHSQEPPIIFRDLKPDNIIVQPDGQVKLIDFGIARLFADGAATDTVPLGSIGYSPPEQFGRFQTDARSDIYSLGATLHHLLTGYDPAGKPFRFPPVRSLNPGVSLELSDLIGRCVSIDPVLRPADVLEVRLALLAITDESTAEFERNADKSYISLPVFALSEDDTPTIAGAEMAGSALTPAVSLRRRVTAGRMLLAGSIVAALILFALLRGLRHPRTNHDAAMTTRTTAHSDVVATIHPEFRARHIAAAERSLARTRDLSVLPPRNTTAPRLHISTPSGSKGRMGALQAAGVQNERKHLAGVQIEPKNPTPAVYHKTSAGKHFSLRHAAHRSHPQRQHSSDDVYDVGDGRDDLEAQLRADMKHDLGFDDSP